MSKHLYLDLETFSEIPIKNGTHAYAEHAEVMLFAWAIDSDPVQIWDVTAGTKTPLELRLALKNPDVLIYAHNSHFDRTVLNHAMPGVAAGGAERWRDTMVSALAKVAHKHVHHLMSLTETPVNICYFCRPGIWFTIK
ncbi:DNA polymerase [Izhakiella capsodis]|uniref:DNA polymerase n=1 Tax=Izhakiella capsodis TaxID=1367852 RepID=A0A1I5AGR5_9GAMM|nr:DNA polymerase [Izhakiella capsodis]